MNNRQCIQCKLSLPLAKFFKNRARKDGISAICSTCSNKRLKHYRATHREKCLEVSRRSARAWYHTPQGISVRLKTLYGISLDEWQQMANSQGGRCAICGLVPAKKLNVDHCHKTKKVRGLLCQPCNRALGDLRDSPIIAIRAALYLLKHQ